jgi:heme exporter protein CcmD
MWEHGEYIWSAYAAAAVILPALAVASLVRLRAALARQAVLERRLEAMRAADGDE